MMVKVRFKEKSLNYLVLEKEEIDISSTDQGDVIYFFSSLNKIDKNFFINFVEDNIILIGDEKNDPKNLTPVTDLLSLLSDDDDDDKIETIYQYKADSDVFKRLQLNFLKRNPLKLINVVVDDFNKLNNLFFDYIYNELDGDKLLENHIRKNGELFDYKKSKDLLKKDLSSYAKDYGYTYSVMLSDKDFVDNCDLSFIKEINEFSI